MKPYGLPRIKDVEFPDVADIHAFGLKSSIGGKDYHKNKEAKAKARRSFKKVARHSAKLEIKKEL